MATFEYFLDHLQRIKTPTALPPPIPLPPQTPPTKSEMSTISVGSVTPSLSLSS